MSTYQFEALMRPASVALVGASTRPGSLGQAVLANLRDAGFAGRLDLVNPEHDGIDGQPCFRDLADLPEMPDLVVVCTPAEAVPGIVATAAARKAKACMLMGAGLGRGPGSAAEAVRETARAAGMRVVGPDALALISPAHKLNASHATARVAKGDLALISQSGAVAVGLLDWASGHRLGFSGVVALGEQMDVDFGDCLDHFAMDPATRAILLYVESIRDARKFMSAARAAARVKPVVVIKSGRHGEGARAAATHSGALAGADAVYDAAFRRAGLVRAYDIAEVFAAAETLGRQRPFDGKRIAILTNSGGMGVLAVDRLVDHGATIARLAPETLAALDPILPANWSRANPLDLVGNADGARYAAALDAVIEDDESDAVLLLHVGTRLADPGETAGAIIATLKRRRAARDRLKPVFAAWVGDEDSAGLEAFAAAGIPAFATESDAVRGLMHLVRYREVQRDLTRLPDELPEGFLPDPARARAVVGAALADGRSWLDPLEIHALLAAYGIPAVEPRLAADPDYAANQAEIILATGMPVALKIHSLDILHKSDVDGVRLDLTSTRAVRAAAREMLERVAQLRPQARIAGFLVQPMIRRAHARELIAGIADDATFGPVVLFGRGGIAVEAIADTAMALPPLSLESARDLVARTRVSRVLKAYRNIPAADGEAVALTLVRIAQLAADIPEIRSFDLNPLLADPAGVLALDARFEIAPVPERWAGDHPRMVVKPYPAHWRRRSTLRDGRPVEIRPIRPEDEHLYADFLGRVSQDDLRLRFFSLLGKPGHDFIARLTQIDYARAIAFIAIEPETGTMLGVSRLHADANHHTGEYAILVRSDLKGTGLGWQLMELLIEWARREKLAVVEGQVLRENRTMLRMCEKLGFAIGRDPDDPDLVRATLRL